MSVFAYGVTHGLFGGARLARLEHRWAAARAGAGGGQPRAQRGHVCARVPVLHVRGVLRRARAAAAAGVAPNMRACSLLSRLPHADAMCADFVSTKVS